MNAIFKKTALCALISSLATGCGGGGESSGESNSSAQGRHDFVATGRIDKVGDVDWYSFKTTEANQQLTINVSSNTRRPDIELLSTVYVNDEHGNKVRLYADHSTENSVNTPSVKMNLVIEEPKEIFIAVRDLRDDAADGYEYLVTVDAATKLDASSTFEDALSLNQQCQTEVISSLQDVDTFSFTVAESGVYRFITNYEKKDSKSPTLQKRLFNEDGALLGQLTDATSQGKVYAMTQFLTAGTYYVTVEDVDNDQFDTYSPYTLCAAQSVDVEAGRDDTMDTAGDLTLGSAITGSLDYDKDQDWYRIPVQVSGVGDVNILSLNFDTTTAYEAYRYDVKVVDAQNNALFTHSHNAISGGFNTELKVDSAGPYFLVVTPIDDAVSIQADTGNEVASAQYSATVNTHSVVDSGEAAGNDSIDQSYTLTNNETVHAKIAFIGDQDWYSISVPSETQQIVEVFLKTENEQTGGDVDYSLAIVDGEVKQVIDDNLGGDAPTILKTSFITQKRDDGKAHNLSFRIKDILDNDADAESGYVLTVNHKNIADSLPASGAYPNAIYYHEGIEQEVKAERKEDIVILEDHDLNYDRTFADDRALLIFDGENAHENFTRTTSEDGNTVTFTSEWIGGYVDYQGDQDFFKFNLSALTPTEQKMDEGGNPIFDEENNPVMEDADATWYYEVKVELVAEATDVEYAWKIHKDLDGNQKITNNGNTWTSNADRTYEEKAINIVSGANGEIWGNQKAYEGDFYFKVGDYNMAGAKMNMFQDYDWGYDAPYYVRLTFTYHSGLERAAGNE